MISQNFLPGNVVFARGREWIVLPDSTQQLLRVKPLGGLDEEETAIHTEIETVESKYFDPPKPELHGDFNSCKLLRDAALLSTRACAGPFRSFARIAVEPRPYQLVPLMMALRQETIRLMIADDVGIGKTIETSLIIRELLDRGEISRFAILCPPQLAEQWQRELLEKFHIEAQTVLPSTIGRLERGLRMGSTLFDKYPFLIFSIDFIKSSTRIDEFVRNCPEFVVVDEAHACTLGSRDGRGRQQRHSLLKRISSDPARHLVLVTATPHSGNEAAFRSLASLLKEDFSDLPEDLDTEARSSIRQDLARHLVQRRRADIRQYLNADTSFPTRMDKDASYNLSPEYRSLFDDIVDLAREMVEDPSGKDHHRRVRWWSALALLRSLASSPASAAATLRNRASTAETTSIKEADNYGRAKILDQDEGEEADFFDATPGADTANEEIDEAFHKRLQELALRADDLRGAKDHKLKSVTKMVKELLKEGFHPILFCRFVDTSDYLAEELSKALKGTEVRSITGGLIPMEREARIEELGEHDSRVLVCTDCLSEGINLQEHFNAVIHYDLSWNPTRHEQREGRVDRFGQPTDEVRVITYFGKDNRIDGVVLDVLLRKHKKIKSDLGISVAVPGNSEEVVEALMEGLLLRRNPQDFETEMFSFMNEMDRESLHSQWEDRAKGEKRSRSRFAQHSIKPEEVAAELAEVQEAIGTGPVVRRFFENSLRKAGLNLEETGTDALRITYDPNSPRSLRQVLHPDDNVDQFRISFDMPAPKGSLYLSRTHPMVESLASYVLDASLDEVLQVEGGALASRCGVVRTASVNSRTYLLLLRHRFHLKVIKAEERIFLSEEIRAVAYQGGHESPQWLSQEVVDDLLSATPSGNVDPGLIKDTISEFVGQIHHVLPDLETQAKDRADALLDSHRRVRKARTESGRVSVSPVNQPDLLGAYVLLPAPTF
ncbi:DEAD/DEAH box helicase [Opitutales bacterium]|nr:DEAD/DEAH box helicase [Opitutales bacterium]